MNCPEHLLFKAFNGRLYVWMYWRDVPRRIIPRRVWLNPLRYEIVIRAFGRRLIINREARLARKASNFWFRLTNRTTP